MAQALPANTALRVVQDMASIVAAPRQRTSRRRFDQQQQQQQDGTEINKVQGIGGPVMANGKQVITTQRPIPLLPNYDDKDNNDSNKSKEQVWTALSRLESSSK
jgi:hypothetical protein